MRNRGLQWFMLLAVSIWFGFVVPVHQRGVYRLPGGGDACCSPSNADQTASDSCCAPRSDKHDNSKPTRGYPMDGSCAICQLVAHTLATPPLIWHHPEYRLLDALPCPPLRGQCRSLDWPNHLRGRAPPRSA